MELPLVSVIIPTYNYANFITEAVESILKQSYPCNKIEIIIVDDGSTDNTVEVLKRFIDSGIVKYYYQQNKGKANATSSAIKASRGKYIFNLDADDYLLPDKIGATVGVYESDSSIVHVASAARIYFQEQQNFENEQLPEEILGRTLDGNWLLNKFYKCNILFGGGTTYSARSSVLKTINIPDGVDMYIDEFLILAVLPLGNSFFLHQPQSVWRVHSGNYSGKSPTKEDDLRKARRLMNSSKAVLSYLYNKNYNDELLKIYLIKVATQKIVYKESIKNKRISDVVRYGFEVFFKIKPGWKIIKNYSVLNRLLPTPLLRYLKKIKKSSMVAKT